MNTKIIISVLSIAAVSVFAFGALADTTASPSVSPSPTQTTVAKIACVGTAVNTRESAIDSALNAYTASVNSAYTARANALKDAYTKTTLADVKSAIKKAWADFSNAVKSARKAWQSARLSAWKTFKTSAKICKAPSSISSEDLGRELNGD